MLFGINM